MNTWMSTWKTAFFCAACDGELSQRAKMYSNGRCPLCGHKGPGARTIVANKERAYRVERIAPWWKLWTERTRRVYAVEDAA